MKANGLTSKAPLLDMQVAVFQSGTITRDHAIKLYPCNCCGRSIVLNVTPFGYISMECARLPGDAKRCFYAKPSKKPSWMDCSCPANIKPFVCPNESDSAKQRQKEGIAAMKALAYFTIMNRKLTITDINFDVYHDFRQAMYAIVMMDFSNDPKIRYTPYTVFSRNRYGKSKGKRLLLDKRLFIFHDNAFIILFARYFDVLHFLIGKIANRARNEFLKRLFKRYEME
jgi:hypothetical protein